MIPIFIGGHPRSGTTLLGAMVGAHTDCICTPESQFKTRALRQSCRDKADISTALRWIKEDWRFRIWGLDIGSAPLDELHSYSTLILWIVNAYAEKFGKKNPGLWVDHTPSNVKNAASLLELFPDAKFIHIVRDGRAVASSIIPLDWGANTINGAALSWAKRMSQYVAVESSLGSKKIVRVRFEDLVLDPETTLISICGFLGIDYQSQMVRGGGLKVPQYTLKQHSLIGKGPDQKEVKSWEKELSPRQIEIFESIAGELLLSLGYALKYGRKAKKMNLSERLISGLQEIYRRNMINEFRRKKRIREGIASVHRH